MLNNCLYLQKQYYDIRRTLLQVYERQELQKVINTHQFLDGYVDRCQEELMCINYFL